MIEIVVLAIAAGAFVKGVTGFGLPQIAIPVMAVFVGVEHAVIVLAIPGVVSNAWQLWSQRAARRDCPGLRGLLVAMVGGAAVGTVLLKSLDARVLSIVLAALILVYIVAATTRPSFSFGPRVHRVAAPPVALLAGGLQGATGISGPLLTTYLHGLRLTSAAYVFALSALFLIGSVVQVLTLALLGAYTAELLAQSLLVLVPIAVLLPLGSMARRNLSATAFQRVVLVLLGIMAVKLVLTAVGVG